jgi:hypothetical protein
MLVRCRLFVSLAIMLIGTAAFSFADLITFENIDVNFERSADLPVGYAGLTWSKSLMVRQMGACNEVGYVYAFTGFCTLVEKTGNRYMAELPSERSSHEPGIIAYDLGTFDFNSATLIASWNNDVTARFDGYSNGELISSKLLSLTTGWGNCRPGTTQIDCDRTGTKLPVFVDFGWKGLDKIVLTATGGTSDGIGPFLFYGHEQSSFIIGSMDVDLHPRGGAEAVPEPMSLSLMGSGFVAFGFYLRGMKRSNRCLPILGNGKK